MFRIAISLLILFGWVNGGNLDADEEVCIEETGVSKDLVLEAKGENVVFADHAKYKDFLSCCWKRYGYQNAKGEIDWDKIKVVLERAYKLRVVLKLISKCVDVQGATHGDTVSLVLRCLDDHAPNLPNLHHYYTGHKS